MSPLSGTQVHLTRGAQSATLATVGAALRTYSVNGSDVVVPFGEDEVAPAFHGMVLAPWPNRLADGAYSFGGRNYQTAISEPSRSTMCATTSELSGFVFCASKRSSSNSR